MRRRTFIVGALALAAGAAARHDAEATPRPARPSGAAAAALAWAKRQEGKPYLWGGTGPDAFDCSGLVMKSWLAAGVDIPRTSAEQWAALPHVPSPVPGDLVFFPGGDGTRESPGHVAMITGRHRIIQAYDPDWPIGIYAYDDSAALPGTGPEDVIGYARPRPA